MFIDLTLKISQSRLEELAGAEKALPYGHLGTHFDVMDKEFPLAYLRREGIVFDVAAVAGRDIEAGDIDLSAIGPEMFVGLHSGFGGRCEYGSAAYFSQHPQLSVHLIEQLVDRGVSIIGIDFAGVRRGSGHTPMDQYCADRGLFIVENLHNLDQLLHGRQSVTCVVNTYPLHFEGMTGLPCRVVAEV